MTATVNETGTVDELSRTPDFIGYATKYDLVCADGRTINPGAFLDHDGMTVPLCYMHDHEDNLNVLGHVKLEHRDDGLIAHAYFNETDKGKAAKEQVRNGDIKYLSIFANRLVEQGKKVLKGAIKEVSLVLGGANPGAVIDHVSFGHTEDFDSIMDGEALISTGIAIELPRVVLAHSDTATAVSADTEVRSIPEIMATLNEDQAYAVDFLLGRALSVGSNLEHSDTDGVDADAETDADEQSDADDAEGTDESSDEGSEDQSDEENSEGNADDEADSSEGAESSDDSEDSDEESDDADDSDSSDTEAGTAVQHDSLNQEENSMTTHNVFADADKGGSTMEANNRVVLKHDDVKAIFADVKRTGRPLSAVVDEYALKHGIENIDYLFPDAKLLENDPQFIMRRQEWVQKVLAGVRKQPFARVRTVLADITADEARARGYITGNMKNEEFFTLVKRSTYPTTVYKKQKLDRDDVLDITELDVIAWLKAEMKIMLDEEIAGAILFGDGRSSGHEDKIDEACIRPIASDSELYVTTVRVNLDDANSSAEEIVDRAIESRELYKGTGMPTFFTTAAVIAKFKLAKDGNGQRYYKTNADIAAALDVADVVPVETMGRVSDLIGIMVNLVDYTIGTDRGGQATMFDDFDLDYNKLRYLLETRCSGALTVPKSALVFRKVAAGASLVSPDPVLFNVTTGVATVPTKTGVVYKDAGGSTLTAGPQTAVAPGADFYAKAFPASASYYFADDAHDEWNFTRDEA